MDFKSELGCHDGGKEEATKQEVSREIPPPGPFSDIICLSGVNRKGEVGSREETDEEKRKRERPQRI
jgi:hypothetical protein